MAEEKPEAEKKPVEKEERSMVRILATDIPGNKSVYSGLARIKGVSWSLSNAICNKLNIDKKKKISQLNEKEINEITNFVKNPTLPGFMLNRRKDFDTGEDKHLVGSDLELRKEFDIKRLRQIKSYRGLRHATGQPTRGQRTKAHFRKNKTVGVTGKKKPGKK
jgi:small subunit ribosomal protein S13